MALLTGFLCAPLTGQTVEPASAKSPQDMFDIAAGHYARDAWSMAVDAFDELIVTYPQAPQSNEAYFFLGESLIELHQPQRAQDCFERFVGFFPDDERVPRCEFRIAECLFLLKQDNRALAAMQDFVFDYPENDLREYALPVIGQLRLERNEPQIAQRALEAHHQQFPDSALSDEVQFNLAKSLQMQQRWNEAVVYFRQLSEQPQFSAKDKCLLELGASPSIKTT